MFQLFQKKKDVTTTTTTTNTNNINNNKNNGNLTQYSTIPIMEEEEEEEEKEDEEEVVMMMEEENKKEDDDDKEEEKQQQSFWNYFFNNNNTNNKTNSNGLLQIVLLVILINMAFGVTVGIVPTIMTDSFARRQYYYNNHHRIDDIAAIASNNTNNNNNNNNSSIQQQLHECASYSNNNNNNNNSNTPIDIIIQNECKIAITNAENAAAISSLFYNIFSFICSPLIGSISDIRGRKGILIIGIILQTLPPLTLLLYQITSSIIILHPYWYYITEAITGFVSWQTISISIISDILPIKYRAPGIGIYMAGMMFGLCIGPTITAIITIIIQQQQQQQNRSSSKSSYIYATILSFLFIFIGLITILCFFQESLSSIIIEKAIINNNKNNKKKKYLLLQQQQQQDETIIDDMTSINNNNNNSNNNNNNNNNSNNNNNNTTTTNSRKKKILLLLYVWNNIILRPIDEISILNRNKFFRLLSFLAFISSLVDSGDKTLLLYYVVESLNFTIQDVAILFLLIGFFGIIASGIIMKPLNDRIGERLLLSLSFFLAFITNLFYGLAKTKFILFIGISFAGFTSLSFPTISAMKANNADITEQGRIQGALCSIQALAAGIGPSLLRSVAQLWKQNEGSMFVFAACLQLIACCFTFLLPKDKANSATI